MATTSDADIVLKLYDLRREPLLRNAREFMMTKWHPATAEDFMEVVNAKGSAEENAYFRQATTFWEMCASLVLRGAVDADLYFDSNAEGLALYAKYQKFHAAFAQARGPFMVNTTKLIDQFPRAKTIYDKMLARFSA